MCIRDRPDTALDGLPCGCDGAPLANIGKMPVIIMGPGDLDCLHITDESMSAEMCIRDRGTALRAPFPPVILFLRRKSPDGAGLPLSGAIARLALQDSCYAVSYTHLDVYKRQLHYSKEFDFEAIVPVCAQDGRGEIGRAHV